MSIESPSLRSYEARLHHTVGNGALVSVEVFGIEARGGGGQSGIEVRAWAVHEDDEAAGNKAAKAGSDGPGFRPVKIFAEVTQDRLPVQGAKVVAVVSTRLTTSSPPY